MPIEYSAYLKQEEIVDSPPTKHYRQNKTWVLAKRRTYNQHMQISNEMTEIEYHKLIKVVKSLFADRNEYVFERDYKFDSTESLVLMHMFECDSLFLELYCCFDEFCYVSYYFDNCPFEDEINEYLNRSFLHAQKKHSPLEKGFFDRLKKAQDKKFFYYL